MRNSDDKIRGKPRALRAEEILLWDRVIHSVKPFKRGSGLSAKFSPPPSASTSQNLLKPGDLKLFARMAGEAIREPAKPATEPSRSPPVRQFETLPRKDADRFERIDLHGMTQQVAHEQLRRFLSDCQLRQTRLVLVITGKGRGSFTSADGAPMRYEGVLRRLVPMWLESPSFRGLILDFNMAARHHGGEGALYVRLQKKRG